MATPRLLPIVQQRLGGLLGSIPTVEADTTPASRPAPAFANEPQGSPMQGNMPLLPNVFPQQLGDSFAPMKPGGGRFVSNEDGKMYNGQNFAKPAPVEEPWYKRLMNDPAAIAQLGIGFNSMRLNPDAALAQVLNERVKSIGAERKQNRTTEQVSIQLKNMGKFEEAGLIEANPELAVPIFTAMLKVKAGVAPTAEMQTFASMINGLPEDQQELARRIHLGLAPRAASSLSIPLDRFFQSSFQTGAGTQASAAQGDANRAAMTNAPLRQQFDFGFSALEQALGGTGQTGKILGNIPGLTTGAQIADNAKALLLPIMKSVFRGAGEGVFTDKDQETLEAMLPTRSMTPEAAAKALDSVKMLVSLKLQNPQFDISTYGRGMGSGRAATPAQVGGNTNPAAAQGAPSVRDAADAILNGG